MLLNIPLLAMRSALLRLQKEIDLLQSIALLMDSYPAGWLLLLLTTIPTMAIYRKIPSILSIIKSTLFVATLMESNTRQMDINPTSQQEIQSKSILVSTWE